MQWSCKTSPYHLPKSVKPIDRNNEIKNRIPGRCPQAQERKVWLNGRAYGFGNITLYDQFELTASSGTMVLGGDSGGLVCSVSGLYTMGVVVSGPESNLSIGTFTRYSNLSDQFYVSRY